MDGNGKLEELERMITGSERLDGTDVVARIDAAVNACRALGHEGKVIEEMSGIFAQHLEKLLGEFHERIVERLNEIDRIIGKRGKVPADIHAAERSVLRSSNEPRTG